MKMRKNESDFPVLSMIESFVTPFMYIIEMYCDIVLSLTEEQLCF